MISENKISHIFFVSCSLGGRGRVALIECSSRSGRDTINNSEQTLNNDLENIFLGIG